MICASMVTSSAVVGSSAISSSGLPEQAHGDGDALAHAAGEFVGVLIEPLLGIGNADAVQQRRRLAPLVRRAAGIAILDIDHLPADRQHGIERRHRVLEHHGDAAPAQVAEFGGAQLQQVAAVEQSIRPPVIVALFCNRPMVASARVDFPEPLSPTTPTMLPRGHGQADIAQRMDRPARGPEFDGEILDLQQRRGGHQTIRRSLGSSMSRRHSPRKVKPSVVMISGMPAATTIQGASRIRL